jgi:hypothetical protein
VERALAKGSRVVVIGRLPGRHSCVLLVWAVLDRMGSPFSIGNLDFFSI